MANTLFREESFVSPRVERSASMESLRADLVALVADALSPVALRYGYSDVPLEATIKWRPMVLILGNYSSGKSTLINELLGAPLQATGQAPTDDSFTVLTHDPTVTSGQIRVTEEREGQVLLNDPEYPFAGLKKHGQRFASHFRLKKVNAPFLQNLALIDTPGMLDSIAERDRGYDYQQVIGDLAAIADLVLVLFDPHKAGTVREAHASLRDTLPAKTFEDRVMIVLNRVDECENLTDLLRVYGTLCWNLSQMLGRKDIPQVRLTYAEELAGAGRGKPEYLKHLVNQRQEVMQYIAEAPRFRLDHLAAFMELHGERLQHFLEGLLGYRKLRRRFALRQLAIGALVSGCVGAAVALYLLSHGILADAMTVTGVAALVMVVGTTLWGLAALPAALAGFHKRALRAPKGFTDLDTQSREDSWSAVESHVLKYLERTGGRFNVPEVKKDHSTVRKAMTRGTKEIREQLSELATVRRG
jgi:EH domain-containing protein 1